MKTSYAAISKQLSKDRKDDLIPSKSNKYKKLFSRLLSAPNRTTIDLAHFAIEDEGVEELFTQLNSHPHIVHLFLFDNAITELSIFYLTSGLKKNTLKTLQLYSNPIGCGGIKNIVESLKTHPSLISLGLGDALKVTEDQIDSGCAHAIAGLIANNQTLLELDLSNNKWSNATVEILANNLKANTTLRTLNIANAEETILKYPFDSSGLIYLAYQLRQNYAITHLITGLEHDKFQIKPTRMSPGEFYYKQRLLDDANQEINKYLHRNRKIADILSLMSSYHSYAQMKEGLLVHSLLNQIKFCIPELDGYQHTLPKSAYMNRIIDIFHLLTGLHYLKCENEEKAQGYLNSVSENLKMIATEALEEYRPDTNLHVKLFSMSLH